MYRTTDLNLAAFLQALGHPLRDIKKEAGRGIFVFGDSADLRLDILRWVNDEVIAFAPRAFLNSMRDLKGTVTA